MGRKWKMVALALSALALVTLWLVGWRGSRGPVGGYTHRTTTTTTNCAFFAQEGGPIRPPDRTGRPGRDGTHTGEIWDLSGGSQLHGGPGHTGVDAPYHIHVRDPRTGRPGRGTPVDKNGRIIRPGTRRNDLDRLEGNVGTGATNTNGCTRISDERPHGPLIYPPAPQPPTIVTSQGARGSRAPGGVLLDATAQMLCSLGNLRGAVYDPETRSLVVVGRRTTASPPIDEADWATLLWCAYNGYDPTFSLDPADPLRPDGPKLRCVYSPGLADTHVGKVLYVADVKMKKYAMGLENPGVEGFLDMAELEFRDGSDGRRARSSFSRIWATCGRVGIRRADNSLVFDDAVMRIRTEKMLRTRLGLASSGGQEDPYALEIANSLTRHYGELTAEPAFNTLKQYAAAYALAKWMKQEGVEIDERRVEEMRRGSAETPDIIDAFDTAKEKRINRERRVRGGIMRETETRQVILHGGVDLGVRLPANTNDGEARKLYATVIRSLRQAPANRVFRLSGNGDWVAVVLLLKDA